ncbi:unnamed protein product [Ilex paraguariensis]|uniref:Cycloeucalenol cycloisomerase n=1 Tax=Ilex paraguariensis TaxID=185542 RepID=A0ABC8TLF0_9AQUA
MGGGEVASSSSSLWLAENPSKRWGELFFLLYTPFWLTLCLGIVVPYKLYESFTELEYLLLGLISALPAFLIPMLAIAKADSSIHWKDRYWPSLVPKKPPHAGSLASVFYLDVLSVKASLWIIIFSYVGNYFWTHYFFTVLGASYTFPSWKMNNVPHTTFLLTHVCFLFYHVTSNMTLRRLQHSVADLPDTLQWAFKAAWILALSYFIAYLETLAIANRDEMVSESELVNEEDTSLVLNQMRIDETPGDPWDLPRVAIDALGAAMLVTIILDLWRIFLGPIVPIPDEKQCFQPGLPWFPGHAKGI